MSTTPDGVKVIRFKKAFMTVNGKDYPVSDVEITMDNQLRTRDRMSHKDRAIARHPGATCKKEGMLYVVRDGSGRLIAARASNGNAWEVAARMKPYAAQAIL